MEHDVFNSDDDANNRPSPARLRLQSLSIAQKLPLVAAALILLVGAAVSLGSYAEVRHTARVAAERRIQDLLALVGPGRRTGRQLVDAGLGTASRPAIAAYTDTPDNRHRDAAFAAILTRNGRGGAVLLGSELRDSSGRVLLSTNPEISQSSTDFPPMVAYGDTGAVGTLRMINDTMAYPVSVHLRGVSGPYLVQWRLLGSIGGDPTDIRRLIGSEVTMLIGNVDGSFWSDSHHAMSAPPGNLHRAEPPFEYTRVARDGPVIAGVVPIAGTPWAFGVEFPMRKLLAPSEQFLRAILLVTLVCVGIGVLAAWLLARRLTVPLQQLTRAADTIAAGRDTDEIPIRRTDELGQLAMSFGTMSQQIRESQQRLEGKVNDRTHALHAALRQLEDAQAALVRREKLAMLGQLAGGVGHELRNPLGVMSNAIYYLELVLQTAPEDVRDYLRLLREQVALSSKIVSDLLDTAKLTPPQRRVVTVQSIIASQLARVSVPPAVHVTEEHDPQLPPVEVDPVQIGQIVFNLLTNAVQAMGDTGGTLRIGTRIDGDEVCLRVTDSGPGVAAQHLDKIFEPLFTTKARGIGLGLAVSRGLAQGNGGDLRVISVPGHGATFILSLPLAAAVPA
jgi:signal transduction histidine kinase